MNRAFFAETRAITPFQGFFRWLMPALPRMTSHVGDCQTKVAYPAGQVAPDCKLDSCESLTQAAPHKALRVVRVMEAGQKPSLVGRMVISGRMADVCAELDRMVALETRPH